MRRAAFSLAVAWALLAAAGASAASAVPPGFFGVVPQGRLGQSDLDRMQGVVGTLRVGVYWPAVEPAPGELDFSGLDQIVGPAAEKGIRVLPFVYGTPAWLSADPVRSPLSSPGGGAAWSGFLRSLVARYGPAGRFWQGRQPLPICRWQIWNEPNFVLFWHPRPAPREYARLLDVSNRALAAADPGAKVVSAGVAPVGAGIKPWTFLRRLFRVPGAAADADVVSLHPYSASPRGVEYAVRQTRLALARSGAGRKPLLISEIGVASDAEVPTGFDLGVEGQASFITRSFRLLLANRRRWRIAGIDWFSWQDVRSWEMQCSFCEFSGLVNDAGRPKPSWFAYRRAVAEAVR